MTETVPPSETPDQPDPYAALVAELRRVADDLSDLIGSGLPKPYFCIDIHPHGEGDAAIMAATDAVCRVLLGKPGKAYPVSGGHHYGARGGRGPIDVNVYDKVAGPTERAREAELEKLRAENAELRAAAKLADTGLAYSRADDADDPTPVSPARVPLHTGAMTDGGLVDETTGLVSGGLVASCTVCGGDHYEHPTDGETVVPYGCDGDPCTKLHRHPEVEAPVELLAIVPTATGLVTTTAPVGAVVDPVRRAHVVELTEAVAEQVDRRAAVEAAHVDALIEDNDRAKWAVIRGLRAGEAGRVHNPGLARFMAEREDRRRVAADTVPVPAEDATLTQLPDPDSAGRAAALQHAKETYA